MESVHNLASFPPIKTHQRTLSLSSSMKSPMTRQVSVAASPTVVSAISGLHHRRSVSVDETVDISFKLYKYESGSLSLVSVPEEKLVRAMTQEPHALERIMDPELADADRDAQLAQMLDLPLDGMTTDPETPKTHQRHYSGVYFMNANPDYDAGIPAVHSPWPSHFAVVAKGEPNTMEHRVFLHADGTPVSLWHDVPLRNEDGSLNFICEIPKETAAKFEVATKEQMNPIKQDIKKGKLRFYPYNINWNYGMLPQTWEDPAHVNEELDGIAGDNDPVDVVEIGSQQLETGGIYRVKALGAYAMVDDGELDWKIICIRTEDLMAAKLNDIEDVEREFPGELERIMVWFRDYKIPDGKPPNAFGYNSKPLNSEFAHQVISDTHKLYKNLHEGTRINDGELALK